MASEKINEGNDDNKKVVNDMRRIAIISSFAWIKVANNYGALLQYFALQQYLYNKGHYAFWIRYVLPTNLFRMLINAIRTVLKNPTIAFNTYLCHRSFLAYCKDYLNLSEDKFTEHSLYESYPLADYYITGSDQVWGGTIPANYLCFVKDNHKRIAYAASFGRADISTEQLKIVAPWIKSFSHISVRESSGVDICKAIGCKAEHLLDPTLLIDSNKYPHTNRIVRNNYIFAYFLNVKSLNDIQWQSIIDYAKQKSIELKVCAVQGSQYKFNKKYLVFPSPVEWLTYYRDAELIITNTFHGTVFAIIHHKPFVCILQTGGSAKQNTRMTSLLNMFDLSNRVLDNDKCIEDVAKETINWSQVDDILSKWRNRTDDFFKFL